MTGAAKAYVHGTHRIARPEDTVARVLPLARRMGVTRLAVLTGLDILGVPVVAAVRPNSRSIAVHQGKGLTLASAKASALMEAAECFHAERFAGPLRLASADELEGDVVDLSRLPRVRPEADALSERILWAEARDVAADRPIWVPHEMVTADYTAPAFEDRFVATTNGLASGNHPLEAMLHGLYELIERDALARWHAASPAAIDERALDLGTIGGVCAGLIATFLEARLRVGVWDITTEIGLPVFQCLLVPADAADPVEPEFGFGCHADRDVALSRALTEAAQSRLTRISGARDDFELDAFTAASKAAGRREAERALTGPTGRSFFAAPSCAAADLQSDLDLVCGRLCAAGFGQIACVDLTRPDFGIAVARMIVPGLAHPATADGAAAG